MLSTSSNLDRETQIDELFSTRISTKIGFRVNLIDTIKEIHLL